MSDNEQKSYRRRRGWGNGVMITGALWATLTRLCNLALLFDDDMYSKMFAQIGFIFVTSVGVLIFIIGALIRTSAQKPKIEDEFE